MTSGHLPGQRAENSYTPRRVLLSTKGVVFARGVIDATYAYDGANTDREDEIRAGTPMAQITSSKLWVPCKRTRCNEGGSGSASGQGPSTVIPVDDARAFKAGDRIDIGATGDYDNIDVSSVDYTANEITVASNVSFDPGDAVIASQTTSSVDIKGAEICRGILNEFVKLKDDDATWRDKTFGELIIHGYVDDNQILGDLDAITASGVTNYLNGIIWGDEQEGL